MNGLFNMDGPVVRIGNMMTDMILLSLFWILFSLPVVTMGASTTALFYVATKRVSDKEGYLTRDFWKSFKLNFVQSTLVWLFLLLAGGVLVFNISHTEMFGQWGKLMYIIQLFFALELILVSLYIFPLIARFEMTFKALIKTAFFMANRHVFSSLICILITAAALVVTYLTGIAIFIVPGIYAIASSYFMMKIFRKYRPELDEI